MRWLTGGAPVSGCFNYQVYKKPKESQVLIIYISPPEFLFIKLLAKSVKKSKNENAISVCLKSAFKPLQCNCAVYILFLKSKIQARKAVSLAQDKCETPGQAVGIRYTLFSHDKSR